MSRPAIKWGELERILIRKGCTITGSGGEKMIRGPLTGGTDRNVVLIGHKSCSRTGSQVLPCYVNKVIKTLGIDLSELGW